MDGLGDSPASGTGVAARGLAVIGYRAVLGLTAITDVLPAGVRFGHWQRVLSALAIRNGLASIPRCLRHSRLLPVPPSSEGSGQRQSWTPGLTSP
jgi:hypothetical protein